MANLKANRYTKRFLLVGLYLSLPIILLFTNPQNLPLPLLILPILIVFAIIYTTVYLIVGRKVSAAKHLSKTRLIIISGVSALMPVILIVLASIKQFTFRDILLAVALIVCIAWYLLKIDFLKS